MFTCAHPAIEAAVRAPLILQVVLGLDAKTIASAFLTSPAAMGKRLGRAKDKIRKAGIPFRVPEREELPDGSRPCWTPSMPRSPKVGPIQAVTVRRAAGSDGGSHVFGEAGEGVAAGGTGSSGPLSLLLHAEARRRRGDRRTVSMCRWGSRIPRCGMRG